jgi:hypothetical protein
MKEELTEAYPMSSDLSRAAQTSPKVALGIASASMPLA